MEFRILGPLEVCGETGTLPLGGAKQRALLAILLVHANEVVSAERLLDDLWGERQPRSGAKALHVYVSQLRKVVGEGRILTQPPGYVLRLGQKEFDVARVERLREQARGAEPHEASALLRDALATWRGPPLADVAFESFAQPEIARLEELRTGTLEQRIDADLALGRHSELIGELEALVREHPLRERLRGQLMLALYRSGRQVEALNAYQDARRILVEELGVEPNRALSELHQAILRHDESIELPVAEPVAEEPRGVFVGRNAELGELVTALDGAFAGRGRLFLLVGEPGIGKSRLAQELAAHAAARGARVLVGRCWEAGGAPAYWPWIESLRSYVRERESEALRGELGTGATEIAQIVPEVRRAFPDLPAPIALESEGARFRLFDAIADFLQRASADRPIVLVLDDLHAADAPSLLLLQYLARGLGSTRMVVVGVCRDVDPVPGESLTAMLAGLAREPVTRRVRLHGLSEPDIEELVELTASELASPELAEALHARTEGNPLFVAETIRWLTAEGGPSTNAKRIAVPETVRDVIARRLTHLSDECNAMLGLASVLGRDFALAPLARLSDTEEDDVLEELESAVAARIVTEVNDALGGFRFAHVLIRDALYDDLTPARRVRLHRQAARVLEDLLGDEPGPHLAELARHAIAGRDFVRAFDYSRRAGDHALHVLAYEEAARHYESALEALELGGGGDEATRCHVLLALGEAQSRAGSSEAARASFLRASESARKLRLPRELGRAAAGYGGRIVFARAGSDMRMVALLEEALAELGDEDLGLRARLLARLAGALRDEHGRDRRDALSREAVAVARRSDDPAALADAINGRTAAIMAPDTLEECLALGTELCELADRIGDKERAAYGHIVRIHAEVQLGDIRAAHADLAAALRIADDLRQPVHLWQVRGIQAMLALASGSIREAEELVERAVADGERAQPAMALPVYQLQRYTLSELRGGLEEVEPAICDLVATYPARPVLRCVLAHLRASLGRLPEAKRALGDLARNDFSALPFDAEWLYGVSLLAETCAVLRETRPAATLYRLLLPWAALNVADIAEGMRGSASRSLGILATTRRRWADAERHFEDALEMNARMRAAPWLARTQQDYAQMLRARGESRDAERAEELSEAAVALYREMGMAPSVAAVTGSSS
jgi:DNA-binding SARP family transcriptional activator